MTDILVTRLILLCQEFFGGEENREELCSVIAEYDNLSPRLPIPFGVSDVAWARWRLAYGRSRESEICLMSSLDREAIAYGYYLLKQEGPEVK